MFKYLVLLFLVIELTQVQGYTMTYYGHAAVSEEIKGECRGHTGISLEEANTLPSQIPTLSLKKKCYLKCVFEKKGYVDESGMLDIEKMKSEKYIMQKMGEKKAKKLFACMTSINTPVKDCEQIKEVVDCFVFM